MRYKAFTSIYMRHFRLVRMFHYYFCCSFCLVWKRWWKDWLMWYFAAPSLESYPLNMVGRVGHTGWQGDSQLGTHQLIPYAVGHSMDPRASMAPSVTPSLSQPPPPPLHYSIQQQNPCSDVIPFRNYHHQVPATSSSACSGRR